MASVFAIGRPRAVLRLTVAEVHEAHADFVWKTLQRFGVPARDLEDALQEVFLVVHRKLSTFDGSARITTWLYAICFRVAAGHRRRAHHRRELITSELDDQPAEGAAHDPEALVLQRESRQRLEQALDALNLERRAVFVMFELEGLATPEIAQILGVPIGTVHSRLHAARAEFVRAVQRLARRDKRSP